MDTVGTDVKEVQMFDSVLLTRALMRLADSNRTVEDKAASHELKRVIVWLESQGLLSNVSDGLDEDDSTPVLSNYLPQ